MQGKIEKHLLHAVSALNAKEERLFFGESQITINQIEISLQYNESDTEFRNEFLALHKNLKNIAKRFKSFIRSKANVQFSEEPTVVIGPETKLEDYRLQQKNIVQIMIDLETGVPNKEIASAIHDFFKDEMASRLWYLDIMCLTFNGLRYIPAHNIFENEALPEYIVTPLGESKRLRVYVIRQINVGLRPGTSVAREGNFLNKQNTKRHIQCRGLQYELTFNPPIQVHPDLEIKSSRLHAEQHSLVEIDIQMKYRGNLEHLILKKIAFDMQVIVYGNLNSDIRNDIDLEFIVRFNGKRFVISERSEKRREHLNQAKQWSAYEYPIFLDEAFYNDPADIARMSEQVNE